MIAKYLAKLFSYPLHLIVKHIKLTFVNVAFRTSKKVAATIFKKKKQYCVGGGYF